ncbi:hypothetical protein RN001_010836 [Aquatica leii]|uniref:Uncharacterized protein n=1 Tax=Aquatica leii TaxID=1421715 RepID=A0AAN7Q3L4_9COLE|nr:hypothetical protein RN001_010836 [Aquatica leii]
MVLIFSIFLFKFIPANKTSSNTTSSGRSNNSNVTNITSINITKLIVNNRLNLSKDFCMSYIWNYSMVEFECLGEIMDQLNNTKSILDVIDLLDRSMYIRRNHKDVRCWFGCVCKKMKLLNATNAVVDEELEIFARVLVNNSHTEDEIDEDCADLELTLKGLDYCDMGFKLYICGIINEANTIVDDKLRAFSEFITKHNFEITEAIEHECADVKTTYKDYNYCDMGFQLG